MAVILKVEPADRYLHPVTRWLFRRVIANLVENALQAAREAGREPQVVIRVERRPDRERAAILVDEQWSRCSRAERQRVFRSLCHLPAGRHGPGPGHRAQDRHRPTVATYR